MANSFSDTYVLLSVCTQIKASGRNESQDPPQILIYGILIKATVGRTVILHRVLFRAGDSRDISLNLRLQVLKLRIRFKPKSQVGAESVPILSATYVHDYCQVSRD